jgi:pimeloyl-ACP methyl ester carboxylesterase
MDGLFIKRRILIKNLRLFISTRTPAVNNSLNILDIGFRLPYADVLYRYLNANIVLVGYRGYGYSEGFPTEEGLMNDSEAIYNYVIDNLASKVNLDDIYIFGRSLGGAVAIYLVDKLSPKVKQILTKK